MIAACAAAARGVGDIAFTLEKDPGDGTLPRDTERRSRAAIKRDFSLICGLNPGAVSSAAASALFLSSWILCYLIFSPYYTTSWLPMMFLGINFPVAFDLRGLFCARISVLFDLQDDSPLSESYTGLSTLPTSVLNLFMFLWTFD